MDIGHPDHVIPSERPVAMADDQSQMMTLCPRSKLILIN